MPEQQSKKVSSGLDEPKLKTDSDRYRDPGRKKPVSAKTPAEPSSEPLQMSDPEFVPDEMGTEKPEVSESPSEARTPETGRSRSTGEKTSPLERMRGQAKSRIEEQEPQAVRKPLLRKEGKDHSRIQRSGGKTSRSLDSIRGENSVRKPVSERTGSILRLNHPEYEVPESADGLTENTAPETAENSVKKPDPLHKSKANTPADSKKISTSAGGKRPKISVSQTGSEKISTGNTGAVTGKFRGLNRSRKALIKTGKFNPAAGIEGAAALPRTKKLGTVMTAAGAVRSPGSALAYPFILAIGFWLVMMLFRLLFPILAVVLLLGLLPENPHDVGVDRMTYLVTKYQGNETNNFLFNGFGTFGLRDEEDIMDLVDYLYNERNEEGRYDCFREYTSEYKDSYTRADRLALHALWMTRNIHYADFLQDQQRFMIEKYYLKEEAEIEEEYEIILDGASYELKSSILALNFFFQTQDDFEFDREKLYDDIDWLGDSEDDIMDDLFDRAKTTDLSCHCSGFDCFDGAIICLKMMGMKGGSPLLRKDI